MGKLCQMFTGLAWMVSCSIVHTFMLGKVAYDENNCKKESAHTLVPFGVCWQCSALIRSIKPQYFADVQLSKNKQARVS